MTTAHKPISAGGRRVFIAGATGVIGARLIPLLLDLGDVVAGMTRSASKSQGLRALGAQPVVCDVYDAPRLHAVVAAFQPDIVVHQLTDLPDDVRRVPEFMSTNARMRREGTRNLVAAARASHVPLIVAQSVAWALPGDAGAAVAELEAAVLPQQGIVLRYGQFYGPGTYYESVPPPAPRIHVDEAARRTVLAFDARPGVVEIAESS